jgi:hypothetical protein
MYNDAKKKQQLGMHGGTAASRLRKMLLFSLVQATNRDTCYRCGNTINNADELSIDHKTPWLDTENPYELFFDLNNIAFSHKMCNITNRRTKTISVICDHCEKPTVKLLRRYKILKKGGQKLFFCDMKCRNDYMSKNLPKLVKLVPHQVSEPPLQSNL